MLLIPLGFVFHIPLRGAIRLAVRAFCETLLLKYLSAWLTLTAATPVPLMLTFLAVYLTLRDGA
jgi:hypothetical protein